MPLKWSKKVQFTIDKTVLDEALKTIQFALLTRPSLAVLNNVKITAEDDNTVNFLLTDLEIAISCQVSAEVSQAGTTTLPTRTLISIVRRLPIDTVKLVSDPEQFTNISSHEINFRILGINSSEFPTPFVKPEGHRLSLKKSLLRKMVIYTAVATGNDPTRPIISGPLITIKPENISCVTTDGKRLAMISQSIAGNCEGSFVIPPKTNNALMKLMAGDGDVEVSFDEKTVQFDFDNEFGQPTIICSKLIEGRYPNYQAIIPNSFEHEISLPREEFHNALKRITLILTDSDHGVKLSFTNDCLKMHAVTEDDESLETMDISHDGAELTAAFNPIFLMDPLKRLECEKITLKFNDTRTAASLHGDNDFIYILMPMRM